MSPVYDPLTAARITQALGYTPASATLPYISAGDFGAIGNDSTDNTAAINNAITAANQAGGGTVVLGPGVYRYSGRIIGKRFVTLAGVGMYATTLKRTANVPIDFSGTSVADTDHLKGVYLRDLTIDGNGGGYQAPVLKMWWAGEMGGLARVFILNGAGPGIEMLGCWDMRLNDVFVQNCGQANVVSQNTTLAAQLNTADTSATLTDASAFPTAGRLRCENEVIYYTGKSANTLTGLARGQEGTTSVAHTSGTRIDLCGGEAIRLISPSNDAINNIWIKDIHTGENRVGELRCSEEGGSFTPTRMRWLNWKVETHVLYGGARVPMFNITSLNMSEVKGIDIQAVAFGTGTTRGDAFRLQNVSGTTFDDIVLPESDAGRLESMFNIVGGLNNVRFRDIIHFDVLNTAGFIWAGSNTRITLDNVVATHSGTPTNLLGQAMKTKAGAVSDADYPYTPVDGAFAIDATNSRLYVRVGGVWKSVALT